MKRWENTSSSKYKIWQRWSNLSQHHNGIARLKSLTGCMFMNDKPGWKVPKNRRPIKICVSFRGYAINLEFGGCAPALNPPCVLCQGVSIWTGGAAMGMHFEETCKERCRMLVEKSLKTSCVGTPPSHYLTQSSYSFLFAEICEKSFYDLNFSSTLQFYYWILL